MSVPIVVALLGPMAEAAAQSVMPVRLAETEMTFSRPHDLVLSPDGEFLYVADVGNHAIKVLDPLTLRTVGVFGQGEMRSPHDVAFDAAGRLLVADSGNDRIAAYRVGGTGGTFDAEIVAGLDSPEGVAVAPDGTVSVTNAGRHDVLAVKDGKPAARVGGFGSGPNRYARPHDIAVAPDGRVYAVDPGNDRIQVLTPELEFIEELGGPPFDFDEPKYIAFDARGWLYVADEYNNQVKIFDRDRRPIAVIGSGTRGRGDRLWISDTYNDRILLYRLNGAPRTE